MKLAVNRITGGESADVRVVLAGAEVVFLNLGIEVLAGEHEGIIERSTRVYYLAERLISIILHNGTGAVHYQPDAAEPVVQIEIPRSRMTACVLGKYLGIAVDICFFQRAIGQIQLHQYYRQLACNVNHVFSFGGRAGGGRFLIDAITEGVVFEFDGVIGRPFGLSQLIIPVEGVVNLIGGVVAGDIAVLVPVRVKNEIGRFQLTLICLRTLYPRRP